MKSLTTDEIDLNDALAARRHPRARDRLRRADPPARRRLVVAHPRARDPPQPHRDPRPVRAHDRTGHRSPTTRRSSPRRRAPTCASASSTRAWGVSGANFAVAETGTVCIVESEGNGRMCTTLPPVLVTRRRDREARPDLRRPRGLPAAPAPLVHRRADEPVHVALDRRHRWRRAAGVARRPARQRPDARPRRRDRPPGAALHPLQRVPQRLPGVLAHRRARLRLGLPGPDRRDPHAAARRRRERAVAAVRLDPLRRLLRGLPGQDRHPERAAPPARARSCEARGADGERPRCDALRWIFGELAPLARSRSGSAGSLQRHSFAAA